VGELLAPQTRDSLLASTAILAEGARSASPEAGLDHRIGETLDSMARRGTFLEPTLEVSLRSVSHFDAEHADRPSLPEQYARAVVGFSMVVTREAVKRGVRITAGTDHVAYGPVRDRASLVSELRLLVDSARPFSRQLAMRPRRSAATPRGLSGQSKLDGTLTSCCWTRAPSRTSAISIRCSGSCRQDGCGDPGSCEAEWQAEPERSPRRSLPTLMRKRISALPTRSAPSASRRPARAPLRFRLVAQSARPTRSRHRCRSAHRNIPANTSA
jgi:hypothetical protein